MFHTRLGIVLSLTLLLGGISTTSGPLTPHSPATRTGPFSANSSSPSVESSGAAIEYLKRVMDQFHNRFSVYDDVGSAGNHFTTYAKIPDGNAPVTLNGSFTGNTHSGATAMRCELLTGGAPFGGFFFQNGVLPAGASAPVPNFGEVPNAGIVLTGATFLTFWARGERGGEKVDFFMGGVGRDHVTGNPVTPHPDSSPRLPAFGSVFTLSNGWQKFTIDLSGAPLDYVLGGFAWVAVIENNPSGAVFYLDDIEYELSATRRGQRLDEPRFLKSFTTEPFQTQPPPVGDFDLVNRNAAYTYDNAVALLAFLADGTADGVRRARLIGDAFVYASSHDRFYNDGRLRNAYVAGDITLPPGWTPNNRVGTVPVPGFEREGQGFVEVGQGSIDTGNNAWAMIALLALYKLTSEPSYLTTARTLGALIRTFRNDTGTFKGFQGGIDFPESSNPVRRIFTSTEHNLNVYAAFHTMSQITGETQWLADAQHARQFVESMWETQRGCYLGDAPDPQTRNIAGTLPLDVQSLGVLVLPDALTLHPQVLGCAEQHHRNAHDGFSGFDFNNDKDGVWFEGTAQMAAAYAKAAQPAAAESLRQELRRAQQTSPFGDGGGVAASCHSGLSTGYNDTFGVPINYYRRPHVGATAWLVFSQLALNPYYETPASLIQFSSAAYAAFEAPPGVTTISVSRTGDTTGESFVSYATGGGAASERRDYTAAFGRLRFAPGETKKTFDVLITDDRFNDDGESFDLSLSSPTKAALGAQSAATVNIADDDAANGPSPVRATSFNAEFFVRQHYADFLNRAPDDPGLAFWVNQTTGCGNPDPLVCRINVSAAFYLSIEFQETGFLVYLTHKAAYGNLPGKPVPVPLRDFLADTRQIGGDVQVGVGDWQQKLEANKVAFFGEFVTRPQFTTLYPPSLTAAQFVDRLDANAGSALSQPERDALVNGLSGGTLTRAQVLRAVAEDQTLKDTEFRKAFVLMQYFGYLRRTRTTRRTQASTVGSSGSTNSTSSTGTSSRPRWFGPSSSPSSTATASAGPVWRRSE